jgi:hypothetical protein
MARLIPRSPEVPLLANSRQRAYADGQDLTRAGWPSRSRSANGLLVAEPSVGPQRRYVGPADGYAPAALENQGISTALLLDSLDRGAGHPPGPVHLGAGDPVQLGDRVGESQKNEGLAGGGVYPQVVVLADGGVNIRRAKFGRQTRPQPDRRGRCGAGFGAGVMAPETRRAAHI